MSAPPSQFSSPSMPAQDPPIASAMPRLAEIDGSTGVRGRQQAAEMAMPVRPSTSGPSRSSDADTTIEGNRIGRNHPLFEHLAPEDSYLDGVYWVSPFCCL